eukprot:9857761-Alexandrium_andersonii.AAC.1
MRRRRGEAEAEAHRSGSAPARFRQQVARRAMGRGPGDARARPTGREQRGGPLAPQLAPELGGHERLHAGEHAGKQLVVTRLPGHAARRLARLVLRERAHLADLGCRT